MTQDDFYFRDPTKFEARDSRQSESWSHGGRFVELGWGRAGARGRGPAEPRHLLTSTRRRPRTAEPRGLLGPEPRPCFAYFHSKNASNFSWLPAWARVIARDETTKPHPAPSPLARLGRLHLGISTGTRVIGLKDHEPPRRRRSDTARGTRLMFMQTSPRRVEPRLSCPRVRAERRGAVIYHGDWCSTSFPFNRSHRPIVRIRVSS